MRGDDGLLELERAQAELEQLAESKPHWVREPEPEPEPTRFPDLHSGPRQPPEERTSFGRALRGGAAQPVIRCARCDEAAPLPAEVHAQFRGEPGGDPELPVMVPVPRGWFPTSTGDGIVCARCATDDEISEWLLWLPAPNLSRTVPTTADPAAPDRPPTCRGS